jgi:drug/metabolite transporter (DMT)-like permease
MTRQHTDLDASAMAIMTLLCALWGVNQVTIKVANTGISPILQAGLRSAGASFLVWGWASWRGIRLWQRDGTSGVGLLVAALFAAEFALLNWGLVYTTASRGVLFLYTAPVVVAVGAHFFLPGERLRPLHILGIACAAGGIAITFSDALILPTGHQLVGDVLVLLAAVCWGATTIIVKASRLSRASPHRVLLYQLAGSAVLLLALSPAMGESGFGEVTPLVVAALGFQIVVIAFASYLTWFWLVSRFPAFKLSMFSFLAPLFGLLAGGLLLGERITAALALAMVLVGAGIYLVNRAKPSAAPAAADEDGSLAADAAGQID